MERGEIRWYTFKKPDKKRPVLIISRSSVSPYLNEVTVAPLTTTIRDIPSEVVLSKADGMPRPSAVNCDHIQTVSKQRLGSLVTMLSGQRMNEVSRAIRFALDAEG
jgi:mRNA interferase MazF